MSKLGMDSFSDSILGRDPVTRRNRALIGELQSPTTDVFHLDHLQEAFVLGSELRAEPCFVSSDLLQAAT